MHVSKDFISSANPNGTHSIIFNISLATTMATEFEAREEIVEKLRMLAFLLEENMLESI